MVQIELPVSDTTRPLSEIFADLAPRVRRMAVRWVGEDRADDVVQETFLRACRAYDRYEEEGKAWPWIRSIAQHVCTDVTRRARSDAAALERVRSYCWRTGADDTIAGVLAREDEAALKAALLQLNPRQRHVLVLRDLAGLSSREIATALDMTVEAVKSVLKRGRTAFRTAYAAVDDGYGGVVAVGMFAGLRRAWRRLTAVTAGPSATILACALVVTTVIALQQLARPWLSETNVSQTGPRAASAGRAGPGSQSHATAAHRRAAPRTAEELAADAALAAPAHHRAHDTNDNIPVVILRSQPTVPRFTPGPGRSVSPSLVTLPKLDTGGESSSVAIDTNVDTCDVQTDAATDEVPAQQTLSDVESTAGCTEVGVTTLVAVPANPPDEVPVPSSVTADSESIAATQDSTERNAENLAGEAQDMTVPSPQPPTMTDEAPSIPMG